MSTGGEILLYGPPKGIQYDIPAGSRLLETPFQHIGERTEGYSQYTQDI